MDTLLTLITHSRGEQKPPPCSALEILLCGMALTTLIGGAFCFVMAYSDRSTTELAIGVAALFVGLLLFAQSYVLRWLQLIEWRLETRADSAMIQSTISQSAA